MFNVIAHACMMLISIKIISLLFILAVYERNIILFCQFVHTHMMSICARQCAANYHINLHKCSVRCVYILYECECASSHDQ